MVVERLIGTHNGDGAVHAILDISATHLLEELAVRVDELEAELGRPLVVIAESDLNDPRVIREREIGGYGMDAQWSDDFHHAVHALLTGERTGYYADFGSVRHLAKALRQAFVYDGCYSVHRRRHGRPPRGSRRGASSATRRPTTRSGTGPGATA